MTAADVRPAALRVTAPDPGPAPPPATPPPSTPRRSWFPPDLRSRLSAVLDRASPASWPVVLAVTVAGVLLVGLSYRVAALGGPADLYYAVFWAGMLPPVLLLGHRLAARARSRADRVLALTLYAALTAVPKFLRNPSAPSYHDEYAHWRQTVDVLRDGQLFHPNGLIPIVQYFPGTSAVTAVVSRLTGLDAWYSGQTVLFTAHVLAVLGVFVAGQALVGSARAGAIAALVYGLNPSAMYFDTQFAYEGIAIALFCWVVALTASAASETDRRRRLGLTAAALLCAAGAVVTHHLTTVFLLATLWTTTAVVTVAPWLLARLVRGDAARVPRHGRPAWWSVSVGTTALAAAWLLLVARPTISYLSPYFGSSVGELSTMATDEPDAGRVLLAASVQPLWERGLTALAPAVVGLVCLRALLGLRTRLPAERADLLGLGLFGLLYFPSVLFLLAPMGAEGARRSWGFSYLGVALLVACAVERPAGRLPGLLARRVRRAADRLTRPLRGRRRGAVALAALGVVLVGNVGAGLNDPYRFPGPFRWGTDTTSASAEARAVAARLAAELGPVGVVTDRYTGEQLIAYGDVRAAAPSPGFPAWELVQTGEDPTTSLARMLVGSGYDYLVVDRRMADEPAFNGDNYGPGDPLPGRATPRAYLDRLDHARWASLIMSTDHLRVYRLNLPLLVTTVEGAR